MNAVGREARGCANKHYRHHAYVAETVSAIRLYISLRCPDWKSWHIYDDIHFLGW